MGKAILYIAMTLDGYIAGENDDLSFLEYTKGIAASNRGKVEPFETFFADVGSLIIGKRTYDWEAEHAGGDVHPVPKFVLTSEKQTVTNNVTYTSEPIKEVMAKAKAAAKGKNVWVEGGASVAQQFLREGLIDVLDLYVFPQILGKGIRLFGELEKSIKLELLETNSSNGMVQLRYSVS